ncbi:MAG: hypothetical protein IT547_04735 [Hyphomonadaceae bacterium]|nr:hypothetical protein [Hyphomonadaceae bacterium]
MPKQTNRDPYAPPPMHHDRSGPVLRVALLAVLLGAAGLGYAWFAGQETTPLAPPAEQQQLADAGYDAAPPAAPVTTPETAEPAPAPVPAQRRAAPVERTPAAESGPTPPAAITPVPVTPAPIPPIDVPPPTGTQGE